MIAMYAVLVDWPGDSVQLQPCYRVLDGLPYAPVMCVSQGLECGSHAAAPAALTIRRGLQRTPVPVRNPDDGDGRTQADSLPHSVLVPVAQGRICRGGFSTSPYGRCLCHSPDHPRNAVNERHHPITPVVITDTANGISAAHAGVDTVVRRSYPCRMVWSAAAMLPHQPRSRSGADCSGLPCRYVTLMMGIAERRPTTCPTACWCWWCRGGFRRGGF
jgi:hypothetical protein